MILTVKMTTIMTLRFLCRRQNMRSKPTNLLTGTSSIWNTTQAVKCENFSCKVTRAVIFRRQVSETARESLDLKLKRTRKILRRIRPTKISWDIWINHRSHIERTHPWEKIWLKCPSGSPRTNSTKSKTTRRQARSRRKPRRVSASSPGNWMILKAWFRWWARNSSQGATSSHR